MYTKVGKEQRKLLKTVVGEAVEEFDEGLSNFCNKDMVEENYPYEELAEHVINAIKGEYNID